MSRHPKRRRIRLADIPPIDPTRAAVDPCPADLADRTLTAIREDDELTALASAVGVLRGPAIVGALLLALAAILTAPPAAPPTTSAAHIDTRSWASTIDSQAVTRG